MKYKLLATCVAVGLLAGCGDDPSPTSVQAYDGEIQGIAGTYECENGTSGVIPATDSNGYAEIENKTVIYYPETCTFTFEPTEGAFDVTNGKDMSELSLSIPRGFAEAGKKPTATPFTTLVYKALGSASYSSSTATDVFKKLGLDTLINDSGVSVDDLMTNLDDVIKGLRADPNTASYAVKLVATTQVLSDVLVQAQTTAGSSLTVDNIANAAQNLVTKVVEVYPNFPQDSSGKVKFVTLTDVDIDAIKDSVISAAELEKIISKADIEDAAEDATTDGTPKNPTTDTDTGGSGGTGGTGGTGSIGAGTGGA